MKKVAITARAASFVEEWAKWFESERGPGYVPAIVWQVTNSSTPNFVPQLTVGFEKREAIDRSRVMDCEGKEVEIYLYVADELFGVDGRKIVDLRDNTLVIVDEEESVS